MNKLNERLHTKHWSQCQGLPKGSHPIPSIMKWKLKKIIFQYGEDIIMHGGVWSIESGWKKCSCVGEG